MKSTLLIVLCIAITSVYCYPSPGSAKMDYLVRDIEDTLAQIPPEEQLNFIKYHLSLGYDLNQKVNEWPDNVTSDFALALFKYAMKSHQITDPMLLKAARYIVCFEDGSCVDMGDIGVHP